jgi:hypothetical protein
MKEPNKKAQNKFNRMVRFYLINLHFSIYYTGSVNKFVTTGADGPHVTCSLQCGVYVKITDHTRRKIIKILTNITDPRKNVLHK